MTAQTIQSTDVMIHDGHAKITLALKQAKNGDLFVSLKDSSAGYTQGRILSQASSINSSQRWGLSETR
jgi:hypothetical protein